MAKALVTITCARCRRTKQVERRRWKQKFCSHRCQAALISLEARLRGAARSKVVRRQQALAKLAGMTPVQIYRKGFGAGWHAGVRYVRRCQEAA